MKATGIVRNIDDLGRVVVPKELRRVLNMPSGTPLEFYTEEGNKIVLKKYEPDCIFCGDTKEVKEYEGKKVCKKCANKIIEDMLILEMVKKRDASDNGKRYSYEEVIEKIKKRISE